ncbi:MAG: DUF1800 domain-containing protein, partial [Chloroflexi bacterium CFX6]|nr:DUF1800 domain-containing protein [Chloroflexi bacterium CFX6]
PDLAALLHSRAAFGPRPGDVERVRQMGPAAWLEEQLRPAAIDDGVAEAGLAALNYTTLTMTAAELLAVEQVGTIVNQLVAATVYRQAFSRRALFEVMTDFWSDHFSVAIRDGQVRYFKTVDDREVIRRHALGGFKPLLTASAHSPAMLEFLDNAVNFANRINENYAREIMELHTLGVAVDGVPYTEDDIKEVARCFTGWTILRRGGDAALRGTFTFSAGQHDRGVKRVLGHTIPGGRGEEDGLAVIDILCDHPATARFLATKLVRRFVTDDPGQTPEIVDAVAAAYARTDGDIAAMLRALFGHAQFAGSFARFGGKLCRPLDHAARVLRALDVPIASFATAMAEVTSARGANFLNATGHVPFYWPTPDGFPDVKEAWSASSGLLARWNLGLRLAGAGPDRRSAFNPAAQMPADIARAGAAVDWWIDRLLHRPMLAADRATLVDYLTQGGTDQDGLTPAMRARLPELIALVLDSPYFLWR